MSTRIRPKIPARRSNVQDCIENLQDSTGRFIGARQNEEPMAERGRTQWYPLMGACEYFVYNCHPGLFDFFLF